MIFLFANACFAENRQLPDKSHLLYHAGLAEEHAKFIRKFPIFDDCSVEVHISEKTQTPDHLAILIKLNEAALLKKASELRQEALAMSKLVTGIDSSQKFSNITQADLDRYLHRIEQGIRSVSSNVFSLTPEDIEIKFLKDEA